MAPAVSATGMSTTMEVSTAPMMKSSMGVCMSMNGDILRGKGGIAAEVMLRNFMAKRPIIITGNAVTGVRRTGDFGAVDRKSVP